MRAIIITAIVLGLVAIPATAGKKPPPAVMHVSTEGKYRATFPAEPKVDTKSYATKLGVLPVTTEKHEVSPMALILSVTYTDYPREAGTITAKAILDSVRDGLKGKDGEVKTDDAITIGEAKHDGRELRITIGKDKVIRARVYLVGRRLYQVMAVGTITTVARPEADVLFNTFTLSE